jgi:hypothetical protein
MNYNKIYDDLMFSRLLLKPQRLKEKREGKYFEGHHIIPKCKGGTGNSSRPKNNPNIVLLTAREHFLSHWLLWRIYGDRQMALAFHKMLSTTNKTKRIISSRGYEEARNAFRLTNIGNQYGLGKTRIVSEEQKKKQSEYMKGRYVGDLNPSKRDDVKKKISDKLKGVKKSKTYSEKLSIRHKNKEKISCPFCNKLTDQLNSKKWHFEFCNKNPNKKIRPTTNFIKNNTYGCKKVKVLETNVIYDSIFEVAKLFKVHPVTISRWIKSGKKISFVN